MAYDGLKTLDLYMYVNSPLINVVVLCLQPWIMSLNMEKLK